MAQGLGSRSASGLVINAFDSYQLEELLVIQITNCNTKIIPTQSGSISKRHIANGASARMPAVQYQGILAVIHNLHGVVCAAQEPDRCWPLDQWTE